MGNYQLEIIHILLCLTFEVFTYFVLCFNLIRSYLGQQQFQEQQQQEASRSVLMMRL